jgi:hypothetical protein
VDGDLAEVEIGRQAARHVVSGIVPPLAVAGKTLVQETREDVPGRFVPASHAGHRRHVVINGQRRETAAAKPIRIGGRPAPGDLLGKTGQARRQGRGEGVFFREVGQMLRKSFLKKAPEVIGGGEIPVRGSQRQETVGVHSLQPDGQPGSRGGEEARQEEDGRIVRHHHAGVPPEGFDQTLPGSGRRLHIRVIEDIRSRQPRRVAGHAVQHEAVMAIAGPAVAAAQRLEDHQRLAQPAGPINSPIQGEAPAQPAEGGHPVEDIGAVRADLALVARAEADVGGCGHGRVG